MGALLIREQTCTKDEACRKKEKEEGQSVELQTTVAEEQAPLSAEVGEAAPDSFIDHGASIEYWNSVDPDVNGMLGGFPQISRIDLRGSANFLAKLRRLSSPSSTPKDKLKLGVDCGAGIGRVTEGFLSNVCEVVDIVEPVEKFVSVLRDGKLKAEGKIGDVFIIGLEQWSPTNDKQYNLIWHQWCVGHLTDSQLVSHLQKCKQFLAPGGWIVVKENLSSHPDEEDLYDDLDSSVIRSEKSFRRIFRDAGLHLAKAETQTGFPKHLGLYAVKLFALRPTAPE